MEVNLNNNITSQNEIKFLEFTEKLKCEAPKGPIAHSKTLDDPQKTSLEIHKTGHDILRVSSLPTPVNCKIRLDPTHIQTSENYTESNENESKNEIPRLGERRVVSLDSLFHEPRIVTCRFCKEVEFIHSLS